MWNQCVFPGRAAGVFSLKQYSGPSHPTSSTILTPYCHQSFGLIVLFIIHRLCWKCGGGFLAFHMPPFGLQDPDLHRISSTAEAQDPTERRIPY
jgi:hypothetical protein